MRTLSPEAMEIRSWPSAQIIAGRDRASMRTEISWSGASMTGRARSEWGQIAISDRHVSRGWTIAPPQESA